MYVYNNAVKCERKYKTTLTEHTCTWSSWFDTLHWHLSLYHHAHVQIILPYKQDIYSKQRKEEGRGEREGEREKRREEKRERERERADLSAFRAYSSIFIRLTKSCIKFSCPFLSPWRNAIFAYNKYTSNKTSTHPLLVHQSYYAATVIAKSFTVATA